MRDGRGGAESRAWRMLELVRSDCANHQARGSDVRVSQQWTLCRCLCVACDGHEAITRMHELAASFRVVLVPPGYKHAQGSWRWKIKRCSLVSGFLPCVSWVSLFRGEEKKSSIKFTALYAPWAMTRGDCWAARAQSSISFRCREIGPRRQSISMSRSRPTWRIKLNIGNKGRVPAFLGLVWWASTVRSNGKRSAANVTRPATHVRARGSSFSRRLGNHWVVTVTLARSISRAGPRVGHGPPSGTKMSKLHVRICRNSELSLVMVRLLAWR